MEKAPTDSLPAIGFMQGRLSPLVDRKIQAFPWDYWRQEFVLAEKFGFPLMEWTLDQDRLYDNPVMTATGRREIFDLCQRHGVQIRSLTGDCFMQAPFYKAHGSLREELLQDFRRVVESCGALRIRYVVVPLEDNGRLENSGQEEDLRRGLDQLTGLLRDSGVLVVFESDYPSERLVGLMAKFDPQYFGINYDTGNSASRGYNPDAEMAAYGARVLNVHIKDRLFQGGTVPLGTGAADIPGALKALRSAGYQGSFILQTARAGDGHHAGVLCQYRDQVAAWLRELDENEPAP